MRLPAPIETKVSLPAIVTGVMGTLGGALYGCALAFDYITPNPEQSAALSGLGAAVLFVTHVVVAYKAPHTYRPDLLPDDDDLDEHAATALAVAGGADTSSLSVGHEHADEGPDHSRPPS